MTLKIKLFPPTTLRHVSHLSLKPKKPDSDYDYTDLWRISKHTVSIINYKKNTIQCKSQKNKCTCLKFVPAQTKHSINKPCPKLKLPIKKRNS